MDRRPPDSRLPRIDDDTLVPAERLAMPDVPGLRLPRGATTVTPLADWTHPEPAAQSYNALVPQVDRDGNELAGIRLPDIAVPRGTFAGWNLYAPPYPEDELADRDGTFMAFAETRAERERASDPRPSLRERYPGQAGYAAAVRECAAELVRQRLMLAEDSALYNGG